MNRFELLKLLQKTIQEEYTEWLRINEQAPIWTRSAEDITNEQYNTFLAYARYGKTDKVSFPFLTLHQF